MSIVTPKKIFSIPINPKLSQEEFTAFYHWLDQYKDWIADVYFTSRINPFNQDAMGEVIMFNQDKVNLIETALNIQKYLGIKASATFNNIQVPPTQTNLDTFIINFKPLYDAGIRTATIPHTHWMATGQIKAAFPELYVKNTILRNVRRPAEVVALAKEGFDYINLDRDLMRDKDALIRLQDAKKWIKTNLNKDIHYSLLANEGCLGECHMMDEHFEYNNSRNDKDPSYFNSAISRVSCPKWDVEDPAVYLKTANFSPWKADWDEYLDLGIDVFKMHGRESIQRLGETMRKIERFVAGEEILDDNFEDFIGKAQLTGKPIKIWRDKIRNCKFDCWECQYCDKIEEKKDEYDYTAVTKHVVDSIAKSGIPKVNINISGLTSARVQTLLNSLASQCGSYLEVGSYLGATAAAVLHNNPINAYFVDKWEEQIQPAREDIQTEANDYDTFVQNIKPYIGNSNVKVLKGDMLGIDLFQIDHTIDMFMYDGPHDAKSTADAVKYYWPKLSKDCILIFDDANWETVVQGAREALQDMDAHVVYEKLILNSEENPREWWNGLYILVIRKT
jgi:predicted O-methyltransferase YrrM